MSLFTFPLEAGTKVPASGVSWKEDARPGPPLPDHGIRMGAGLAVIDCDNPGLESEVRAWLDRTLYPAPMVRTPSGGLHVYIRLAGVPEGFNYARIRRPAVDGWRSAGELRAGPGAYVVSPGSVVEGKRYELLRGSLEALDTLPVLSWDEVTWLLPNERQAASVGPAEAPPVRLLRRTVPGRASKLFDELTNARRGDPVDRYATRSEAEAAAVAVLILAGWSHEEIADEFERRRPGHYADLGARARSAYLRKTYRRTLAHISGDPDRLRSAELYQAAAAAPWPGRGGALDRGVLMALLAHAWQFNGFRVAVSERDIALHAACSHKGAQNALGRLQEDGLISIVEDPTCRRATTYLIDLKTLETRISNHKSHFVREGAPEGLALPGAAGMIYAALSVDPVSVSELAERTGKHPATVRRQLVELAAAGVDLAEKVGRGLWIVGPGAAAGRAERAGPLPVSDQAARFAADRAAWRGLHADCGGECAPGGVTRRDRVHTELAVPVDRPTGVQKRADLPCQVCGARHTGRGCDPASFTAWLGAPSAWKSRQTRISSQGPAPAIVEPEGWHTIDRSQTDELRAAGYQVRLRFGSVRPGGPPPVYFEARRAPA